MRAAFAEIVDYAGLFPPATETMTVAVHQFDRYRRSPDRWMLGRFVVAASRLEELGGALSPANVVLPNDDPWHLSVVLGALIDDELARIAAFERTWRGQGVAVGAIECRVTSVGQVRVLGEQIPGRFHRYFEVPSTGPYDELVREIGAAGAAAKVRTGGTTSDLFPAASLLAEFITACVLHGVRFKATAGLHHPLRGEYPLTYAPDSERHAMYGFVNLLVATTALMNGATSRAAQAILEEDDRDALCWNADGVTWRDQPYAAAQLARAREQLFVGFGSCSFREPVDELGLGVAA